MSRQPGSRAWGSPLLEHWVSSYVDPALGPRGDQAALQKHHELAGNVSAQQRVALQQ